VVRWERKAAHSQIMMDSNRWCAAHLSQNDTVLNGRGRRRGDAAWRGDVDDSENARQRAASRDPDDPGKNYYSAAFAEFAGIGFRRGRGREVRLVVKYRGELLMGWASGENG